MFLKRAKKCLYYSLGQEEFASKKKNEKATLEALKFEFRVKKTLTKNPNKPVE
jgi:hypothetical protein